MVFLSASVHAGCLEHKLLLLPLGGMKRTLEKAELGKP